MGVRPFPFVLAAALCSAAGARAQVGPAVGADALPQLTTVGVAQAKAGTSGIAATGGFGMLSAQADEGTHQRLFGSIAGALTLVDGIALGLRLDGRYDLHPDDAQGSDDSLVGAPTLRVRLATDVSETFHLGTDLALMIPGKEAPSVAFDSLRADARVLATYAATTGWGIAASAGVRFDKTGNAAPNLNTTRAGDRLSLGLNDFHAVLLGLGAWKRWDALELLGEVTWDPWLGSGAPTALQSPLHVSAGARYLSSDSVAWELLADGLLSKRPQPEGDRLAAIDPRFSVQFGIRITSGYAPVVAVTEPDEPIAAPSEPAVTAPVISAATVRGHITDAAGGPLADVDVQVVREGYEGTARSRADGTFEIADVPLGPATLRITGRRVQPTEQPIDVGSAETAIAVRPEMLPPRGQLRGLIRSFDGTPLAAEISLEPTSQTLHASAEGEFELGLPPGEYQVRISVPGYRPQSRTVQIEDDGVTLLNVDLKKGRR
jgi:hypothetical protein